MKVTSLTRIRNMNLFSAVGQGDASDMERVFAWDDACSQERRCHRERAELEAANRIRDAVSSVSQARYGEWNTIVTMYRPEIVRLVDTSESLRLVPQAYQKHVADTLKWDFLHALVEEAYADLTAPDFYRGLLLLYERGHFPCDWIGEYPEGHIVVY